MPLVEVKHRGLNPERAQQTDASHPEQYFLHNPRRAVTPVNAQSQIPIVLFVFRTVGVQQVHCAASDIDAPGLEIYFVHGDFDRADQRLALRVQHRFDGKILWIQARVIFRLPVVLVDGLLEVAFPIKQTHADEPEAEVAG